MIQSTVDFLGLTILSEQSSEDSLSADPEDLGRHSAFASTSAFTRAGVVAFALGFEMESSSCSRVYFLFSLHDKTILDELTDEHSGVCLSDLLDFVGIHPDSLSSALQNLGSQSLLTLQTHHNL